MKFLGARKLKYTAPEAEIMYLLEIFEQIGILPWLERHPFSSLEFKEILVFMDKEVYGWYSYQNQEAQISLSRDTDSFGQVLHWGRIASVSVVSSYPTQAIQKTMVHELGHHLHRLLGLIDTERYAMSFHIIRSDGVSNYAKMPRRPEEYFAETFAAWVFHRTEFNSLRFSGLCYDRKSIGSA